ncbi:MAG: ECF-type sigma factor [Planctomycetota bacterium]
MDDPPADGPKVPHQKSLPDAGEDFGLIYEELKSLANYFLQRERTGHTLQPTALVHEAFVRLSARSSGGSVLQNRSHFLAIAARVMRHILVDYSRSRGAMKRGGEMVRVTLRDFGEMSLGADDYVVALDEALSRLAELDPRQAKVVELRFFAGLSIEETAKVLDLGTATVERDWAFSKAWLQREVERIGDV